MLVELNPYCYKRQGRKEVHDSVDRAIPRVEAFDPSITILQAKRQLLTHYRRLYQSEWQLDESKENDEKINDAIEIYVRDNMPSVKNKRGYAEK